MVLKRSATPTLPESNAFGNRKRLHGRTRLNHIGNSSIAAPFAIGAAWLVGIIGRLLTKAKISPVCASNTTTVPALALWISHCFIQLIIGKCLNTLIQRQNHVPLRFSDRCCAENPKLSTISPLLSRKTTFAPSAPCRLSSRDNSKPSCPCRRYW